jgi:hypothetical protein
MAGLTRKAEWAAISVKLLFPVKLEGTNLQTFTRCDVNSIIAIRMLFKAQRMLMKAIRDSMPSLTK